MEPGDGRAAAATRRLLAMALTRQELGQALTVNGQAGHKAPLGARRRVQRGAGGSCAAEQHAWPHRHNQTGIIWAAPPRR
jgi:hypothetical protein